jgi:hypothetical protein
MKNLLAAAVLAAFAFTGVAHAQQDSAPFKNVEKKTLTVEELGKMLTAAGFQPKPLYADDNTTVEAYLLTVKNKWRVVVELTPNKKKLLFHVFGMVKLTSEQTNARKLLALLGKQNAMWPAYVDFDAKNSMLHLHMPFLLNGFDVTPDFLSTLVEILTERIEIFNETYNSANASTDLP